jgi:glucokinase
MTVDVDGPDCACGGSGHVEAIASGTALARAARTLLDRGVAPVLSSLASSGEEIDAELVARAAAEGDEECAALLERAWVAVGAACASLVNLLNPEVIVIGGGIAEHHPRLFDVAREQIARRSFEVPARRVRVEKAALGDDVSLIGGLPIVNDRIDDPAFRRATRSAAHATSASGALPS